MSKHLGRGATALAAIALVASACSSGASTAPASQAPGGGESTAPAGGDLPTLAFIAQMPNPSQAFSWKMYQKNAAKYGFKVINFDNGGDVQKQTAAINSAVAQKVAAIAINPVDEAGYVPATKAAMAGGVIVCLSMVPAAESAVDGSTCSVSVDDILGGKTAAEAILKAFPNGATGVEIGGQAGHVAANNRHTGFSQGIAGKNIQVLDYKNPTAWDTAQAQAIAEDMITRYGDKIQFIFCHWDNGATGVINARALTVTAAANTKAYSGKNGTMWPMSNCLPAALAALSIRLDSTTSSAIGFSQNTCLPARDAATLAAQCMRGGRQMSMASKSGFASMSLRPSYFRTPDKSIFAPGGPKFPLMPRQSPASFFLSREHSAVTRTPGTRW
jgi:ABC-type sugar transport system substrate-binding protein